MTETRIMYLLATKARSVDRPLQAICLHAAMMVAFGVLPASAQDKAAAEPALSSVNARDGESPHIRQLAEFDLEPSAESLGEFLAALHPTPEQKESTDALIEQLGHADYQTRESATTQLIRRPFGTTAQLQAAQRGGNAEIRWRARRILDRTERDSRSLLHAVFTTIEQRQLMGLARPLLESAAFCDETYLQNALHRALKATVTAADEPLLSTSLKSPEPRQRVAAMVTLANLVGDKADGEVKFLLNDPHDPVRAAAARLLAGRGKRESLPVLVELLDASDLPIRADAFRTLRALTGESFGYAAYEAAENRVAAKERWNAWMDEHGATAELRLPLDGLPIDLGRLLVCDHSQNKLIEFDLAGKELWQRQVSLQPWACFGLPNGHRLVGSYNERTIFEYDRDGTEIWKVDNLPGGPTSVERLENGNTLIACTEGSQVVEVAPDKSIAWKATLEGRPVDARRLENGNTLVALQNGQKVVEIDPAGKTAWEITGVGAVFSAQRLPDGNTLVCSLNLPQIREFDPTGKVVWSEGEFANPYAAQRLADGNTLVVDRAGVTEIDPKGATVSRLVMPNISRAWRY